jgi:hypothetical protein
MAILQDIRGLNSRQSIAVCRWAARALLESALRESRS